MQQKCTLGISAWQIGPVTPESHTQFFAHNNPFTVSTISQATIRSAQPLRGQTFAVEHSWQADDWTGACFSSQFFVGLHLPFAFTSFHYLCSSPFLKVTSSPDKICWTQRDLKQSSMGAWVKYRQLLHMGALHSSFFQPLVGGADGPLECMESKFHRGVVSIKLTGE